MQASAEQTQSGARQAAPTTQPAQPSVPASSEQSGEERPALSLASLPAAALAAPQDEASQNEASPITLDLYTLTDVHGHTQQVAKKGVVREAGLPAMNCYLKKARATNPNSSFTLLGDNIGASPYISGALKDNPTIAALNTMNPLASTIGNHELDMGQAVFKQRVSSGGAQAVAEVNNSLVDAHASDAASVITTDGAGQASVDVTVVGACEGKAAGEVVNVPVTVVTDFATVVEAGDGLTIPVTCAGAATPNPSPSADAAGDTQSGNQAAPSAQHKNTKSPKGSLARTGADLGGLAGAMFVGAIGVAGCLLGAAAIVTKAKTSSP